ncbi:TPA: hypothetical protein ACHFYT_004703 [Escherichia coli]
MAPQPLQLRKNFGERTANHFAVFVPQPFCAIDKLAVGESHEVRTYTNFTSFRLPSGQGFAPTPRISAYVLNVVSGSLPLPRPLAHYVRSLGLRRAE